MTPRRRKPGISQSLARMFYKAAFYDRDAFLHLVRE